MNVNNKTALLYVFLSFWLHVYFNIPIHTLDQPNIDVPEEIFSDQSLDLTCYVPDNCPDMIPEIHWMYTDYLPDPFFTPDGIAESISPVHSITLTFTPRPMHNGQQLGCRVHYPNTTFVYERLISLDVKCEFHQKMHSFIQNSSCLAFKWSRKYRNYEFLAWVNDKAE